MLLAYVASVDFETVEISGSMDDPDVMRDALLSVGRNGVAIKGNIQYSLFLRKLTAFSICSICRF